MGTEGGVREAGSHEPLGCGLHGGSFLRLPRMESRWGLLCVTVLGFLMHVQGQRDFDLADALDDPEPTKKPSSDIYPKPKPPYRPQPGMSDDSGNIYPKPKPPYRPQPGMSDDSGSIYPRPRPPPRPQPGGSDSGGGYFGNTDRDDGRYPPRPKPPAAGGGSYYPSHDGSGNTHGGGRSRPNSYGNNYDGDGYSTYGNAQGNTVAKIVSPIVSVLVVTLVGAAAGYCQRNRRRNCFRANEPVHV